MKKISSLTLAAFLALSFGGAQATSSSTVRGGPLSYQVIDYRDDGIAAGYTLHNSYLTTSTGTGTAVRDTEDTVNAPSYSSVASPYISGSAAIDTSGAFSLDLSTNNAYGQLIEWTSSSSWVDFVQSITLAPHTGVIVTGHFDFDLTQAAQPRPDGRLLNTEFEFWTQRWSPPINWGDLDYHVWNSMSPGTEEGGFDFTIRLGNFTDAYQTGNLELTAQLITDFQRPTYEPLLPTLVPEPATWLLFAAGVPVAALFARRRRA
ncbi:PEP-CTERM sorting domain-containing protein [Pseudoduganella umbonata]|uniref:PEP-CTERM sorting domain-containing protein n=1 Tax=Pseudoduganella umbonata TaxID=864828 RepID=A0A4P8HVZ1_9BURK|nr:PEP-CTERM sorting domain-containing protein [Pseudoduganella umbonata]MBB3221934.1 hypothetical protein [Pseudoduganella umbonata]QCP14269.1 PEP-CTERM sorting domain-containing protein [Pseudoduganella umbonata]